MHRTSYDQMLYFKNNYLPGAGYMVLDVGSRDVCGIYRGIFAEDNYTGLDCIHGNNVDVVCADPYRWDMLKDNQFDAVISGQAFEHIEFPDRTIKEIERVLKTNGFCCIIAPSTGMKHEEPDYRRFNEHIYYELLRNTSLKVIENYVLFNEHDEWNDAVCIARKNGAKPAKSRLRISQT